MIGIDPGLADTGIGIVSGREMKPCAFCYGSIHTSSTLETAERLNRIYSEVSQVLFDEKPDLLVLEEAFSLERYPKSGITLGKVCGVVLLAGIRSGVPTVEIPVREAKQVLTGNGNASKAQLERAVRSALNAPEPIRPDHASDAVGLALLGLYRYSQLGRHLSMHAYGTAK